jgi:hypothetical protein
MNGVKYGEMLKSARLFTRMGEGIAGSRTTSCSSSLWSSGAVSGPTSVSTSTGLDSTLAPGNLDSLPDGGDFTSDVMFDGIAFDDFLGELAGGVNVLAS